MPPGALPETSPTKTQFTNDNKGLSMVSRDTRTDDEVLADEIAKYRFDPLGYVMFMFPWNSDPSIQQVPLAQGVSEHLTDEDRERFRMRHRQMLAEREKARAEECEFVHEKQPLVGLSRSVPIPLSTSRSQRVANYRGFFNPKCGGRPVCSSRFDVASGGHGGAGG